MEESGQDKEGTATSLSAAGSGTLATGSLKEDSRALQGECGIVEAGFRSLLRLAGGDRTTFLQGMVTNDVASRAVGQGVYAALLTIQGRVVSDMNVLVCEDELWLDLPAERTEAVREGLDRYIIADDVEFVEGDVAPLLYVAGPGAASVLTSVLGDGWFDLPVLAHRVVPFGEETLRVACLSYSGLPGFLIWGSPSLAAKLHAACEAAGARPVAPATLELLRVENGIPRVGFDMGETTLIGEVGLESAISYRKGCYLGQEVVERVAARGQVQRRRVALRGTIPPGGLPLPGSPLRQEGHEIGRLTSVIESPIDGSLRAQGYLRREAWSAGTEVEGEGPQGAFRLVVEELPAEDARLREPLFSPPSAV